MPSGDIDNASRFDALIPPWLFAIRGRFLRYGVAVLLPVAAAVPLLVLVDGDELRLGPVLIIAVIAAAALAGSGPAAAAGLVTLILYWRDGVAPTGSFALPDTPSRVALTGMAVLVGGLPLLTRRIERTVEDVRRLDAERVEVARREADARRAAEAAAAQSQAVTALASAVAGQSSPKDIATAALEHLRFPGPLTEASIALVIGDHLEILASHGTAPAVVAALEAVDVNRSNWLQHVLAGQAAIIDDRAAFALAHPDAQVLRLFPSRSWAVIPFRYQQTIGLLSVHFANPEPLSTYTDYFGVVAAVLAAALERSRAEAAHLEQVEASLAERDRIARTLSTTLLPPTLPTLPGFEAAGWIVPAHGAEIAGDFYDLFAVGDGEWVAVLGDVCGKGAEAAAVAALARYAARATALIDPDPLSIASVAHRALQQDSSPLFCTMAVVRYHRPTGTIGVALAGHPQLRRITPTGVERVGRYGSALGISGGAGVNLTTHPFGDGDILLLFSDGLVERARDFDEDDLDDALARLAPSTAAGLAVDLRNLAAGLRLDRPDDITILAIEAVPVAEERSDPS